MQCNFGEVSRNFRDFSHLSAGFRPPATKLERQKLVLPLETAHHRGLYSRPRQLDDIVMVRILLNDVKETMPTPEYRSQDIGVIRENFYILLTMRNYNTRPVHSAKAIGIREFYPNERCQQPEHFAIPDGPRQARIRRDQHQRPRLVHLSEVGRGA